MALLDLSRVTRVLKDLLEQNLARPELGALTVTVSPQPPERVEAAQNTLSLHLYHVAEEAYYKNVPGAGNDPPNVAKNPLALCLYYILTAHHRSNDEELDPFSQQQLMGLAIKTFHDVPVITDRTVVDGAATPLLEGQGLAGNGNQLQIVMRPISPEDAVSFWTTEEQQTARLSAYYEVRVVMLEPEKPKTSPGRVLAVGTYLVPIGSPAFEDSRSVVRFALPPSTGVGEPQAVETTPARVSTDPGTPAAPHNRLLLRGTDLALGRARTLVWKNALWSRQGFPAVPLDPAANPAWSFDFAGERIRVDLAPQLMVDGSPLTVFPGLYTASLQVVKDREVVLGQLKEIVDASNEVGFLVGPRIAGHGAPDPDRRITVALVPTFDLTHGAGTDEALDVELFVDGRRYERGFVALPPDPADNDGRFDIAANAFTLQPFFDVTVAGEHPLRLVVNGGESQPFWIVLP